MLRFPLRGAALLFSIVTALTVIQLLQISQQQFPVGTTARFELTTGTSQTPKSEVVAGLNALAEASGVIVVKASASAESHATERDLIYFGVEKPESNSPVIRGSEVSWLTGLSGRLIPATSMGDVPVSGDYATTGDEQFFSTLSSWATQQQIGFRSIPDRSVARLSFLMATNSGLGAAWLATILLLACVTLAWFVIRSKRRSLQLLGGVQPYKIHLEDNFRLALSILCWASIGLVVMLGYVALRHGPQHIGPALSPYVKLLLVGGVVVFLTNMVSSIIARPTVAAITTRMPPYKKFSAASRTLQVLCLVMVMIVMPTTVGLFQMAVKMSQEGNVWDSFGNAVTVSVGDSDYLFTTEGAERSQEFFRQAERAGITRVSADLNSLIELDSDSRSGYDSVVIVDKRYLDELGVSPDGDSSSGSLAPVSLASLNESARQLLAEQFKIWVRPGIDLASTHDLYRYEGPGFLAFGNQIGRGGEAQRYHNPLVVVLRDPGENLRANGFLANLMSTGNVFFSDANVVKDLLLKNGLYSDVSGIDRFSDVTLTSAQQVRTEMLAYLGSAILLLTSVAATAWQSALIWTGRNRRRIFTLRMAGQSFSAISGSARRRDLIGAAIGLIIGALIASIAAKFSAPTYVGIGAVLALVLYGLISLVSYAAACRRTFAAVVHREN